MNSNAEPESPFQYGMYAVAVVDVLGQKDAIADLPTPGADLDYDDLVEKLRATVGRVRLVRGSFSSFLDSATARTSALRRAAETSCIYL